MSTEIAILSIIGFFGGMAVGSIIVHLTIQSMIAPSKNKKNGNTPSYPESPHNRLPPTE